MAEARTSTRLTYDYVTRTIARTLGAPTRGYFLLLGAAGFIVSQSKSGMGVWQMSFIVLCVAGGAWLAIMPFLFEYRPAF